MIRWSAFWRGYFDCAPFVLIVIPYSMLFGVVAREAGLDVVQTMAMSVLVIAGASQFTALSLLQDNAPVFIALLASLAVNMRMALYSAALVPHLGRAKLGTRALMSYLMVDQAYAVAYAHFEKNADDPLDVKVAYYFGCMMLICPMWYGFTWFGAVMGQTIPEQFSIDFALPICFTALTAPLIKSPAHAMAALVAAVASLIFVGLPWSLGLMVAAILAIISGAQTELFLKKRNTTAGSGHV